MKKLIYLFLSLLIFACSSDDSDDNSNNNTTTPIITILGQANVTFFQGTPYTDAGATATDDIDGNLTSSIVTSGTVNVNSIGTYTITYSVSNSAGNTGAASRKVNIIEDYENPVYLDDNGITIKAKEWSEVGAVGEINGITYTIVDKLMLLGFIENESDVTKLVTTKITNMNLLFYEATTFNQAIESWDVSNVTGMYCMFWAASLFNKDIGIWDVSNVNNMNSMFNYTVAFNQNLSSWSVNGVTDCTNFSNGATSWTLPQPNFTNCTP